MQKNWVPIDKRTAAVLKAKGFTISDDEIVAKIDGEMTLDIMRSRRVTDGNREVGQGC
jgi:hypothetical protein